MTLCSVVAEFILPNGSPASNGQVIFQLNQPLVTANGTFLGSSSFPLDAYGNLNASVIGNDQQVPGIGSPSYYLITALMSQKGGQFFQGSYSLTGSAMNLSTTAPISWQ